MTKKTARKKTRVASFPLVRHFNFRNPAMLAAVTVTVLVGVYVVARLLAAGVVAFEADAGTLSGQGIQAFTFPNVTVLNNSLYHNISNLTNRSAGAELSYPNGGSSFGPTPTGCVAHDNAIEPSPGLTAILNECGSSDISNNATGAGFFASPNVSDPPSGNWATQGAAAGKGASWPL